MERYFYPIHDQQWDSDHCFLNMTWNLDYPDLILWSKCNAFPYQSRVQLLWLDCLDCHLKSIYGVYFHLKYTQMLIHWFKVLLLNNVSNSLTKWNFTVILVLGITNSESHLVRISIFFQFRRLSANWYHRTFWRLPSSPAYSYICKNEEE